jgi:hypothetical protein
VDECAVYRAGALGGAPLRRLFLPDPWPFPLQLGHEAGTLCTLEPRTLPPSPSLLPPGQRILETKLKKLWLRKCLDLTLPPPRPLLPS